MNMKAVKIALIVILFCCFTISCKKKVKKEKVVQGKVFQIVYVREENTIFDIANMYLKEPERWKELTKYNILESTGRLTANSSLLVPMDMVKNYLRPAFLTYRKGKVYIKRAHKQRWEKLASGYKVLCGDLIKTGKNSKVKIKFENGLLSLGEQRELLLDEKVFREPEKFSTE